MATDKLVEIDHVKDFISREAALSCFSDWIDRYGHEHSADEMVEYQRIEELPAADVRPVVKAEWENEIRLKDENGSLEWHGLCSHCLMTFSAIDAYAERMNFCPNCGADMRRRSGDLAAGTEDEDGEG